ncbi:TPA: cadherin-like beta sandwich domain-containing protein [Candidatus Ventrenecus stercoripullorum]|nr:cadherin-like beta sandwich domain-containing protein [Candidatus Ventrenecus stercoripullorum]
MKIAKKIGIITIIYLALNTLNVSAAGSASISASANYVEEGSKVTFYISLKNVAAWDLTGQGYGATSGCSLGDQGVGDSGTGANINKTLSVTCKTTSVGQVSFSISGNISSANGNNIEKTSVNTSKIVVVTEPREKDTNNYLKSIGVKDYEITPEFNKDTMEYTVDVPATVNKVTIEAEKESSYATVEGTGEKEVDEGANTFEIKVTSETGVERIYKITVNVKDENPINITIDGEEYTIMKNLKNVETPSTYETTTVKINEFDIPAFHSETSGYTLVGVKNSEGKQLLAIYNEDENTYTLYNETKSDQLLLYIMKITEEKEGFIKSTVTINDITYDALKLNENSNYILIYAMDIVTAEKNYYVYDKDNNSYVVYNDELMNMYKTETEKYKQVILYGGVGAIAIIFILLIICMRKPKRSKKKKKELEKREEQEVKIEKIDIQKQKKDEEELEREIEEKLSKKEPSKSSKNPTNNNKKKKNPLKTNTEVLDKVNEATKMIEDFEKTTTLNQEDLKEVKEQNKKTTEELEATMYDLFKEEKPKKRKKKKK